MKLRNSEVPGAIYGLTAGQGDSVSALLNTHNRFERWWQGMLVAGFAAEPWCRRPGWDPEAEQAPAGVAVECRWEVADRRFKYTQSIGRDEKQIDLLVRRGRPRSRVHLVELKWLDGGWSLDDPSQVPGVYKDLQGLRAMGSWPLTSSAWCIVLAYGFATEEDVLDALRCVSDEASETWCRELPLDNCRTQAWVVGLRAA